VSTTGNQDCERKTFTEALPVVPPRARLTSRLQSRLGQAVGDDLMPAAAAARRYGVSDRTAARAFTAYAGTQLADLDAGGLDSHLGGARTLILPGRIGPAARESAWKKSASESSHEGPACR
jgi:Helix-turn-helix domain of transposase family ISL3